MKPKAKSKLTKPDIQGKTVSQPVSVAQVRYIKNVFWTPVIVSADKTPSGKRYEFALEEEKPVEAIDATYLLSLERKQTDTSCCGGSPQNNIKYFMEV